MHAGLLYATLAYASWGLFPLYMKLLAAASPGEILIHRMLWSMAFLVLLQTLRRNWSWLRPALRDRDTLLRFTVSASIVSVNWLIFVWAVNNERVVDASLGYFINPLINVLIAFIVLKERLRRPQWVAVALAAAGVLWLTMTTGQFPWVGLWLATTFAIYGLLRKTARLGPIEGLALETILLAPFALTYFGWLLWTGSSAFAQGPWTLTTLLVIVGPLSAIPLIWFAAGARRLTFATLGLLQYISPTISLMLGIWVFHEPFDAIKLTGFVLIWIALVIYTADLLWSARRATVARVA